MDREVLEKKLLGISRQCNRPELKIKRMLLRLSAFISVHPRLQLPLTLKLPLQLSASVRVRPRRPRLQLPVTLKLPLQLSAAAAAR
jgi:hypothetical protein